MIIDPVFSSEETFRQAFIAGLENMLESDELGAYILVLANASFDAEIFSRLKTPLERQFDVWLDVFRDCASIETDFAPDDVAVFKQLMALGFSGLSVTEHRMQDMWQLQYNQLRSFRPARTAGRKIETLSEAFDVNGFNFNKPFLQKEVFWQGELLGSYVKLLYNKFPFANLHGLFVIDPDANKSQLLQKQDHELVWQLMHTIEDTLPMGMAYNSLGAYASINHQHFQSFVTKKKYPVELACWQHNGGAMHYPLNCKKFIQADQSWDYLQTLHDANIPFNLLYRSGEVYCITRAFQGSYEHAAWTSGFAWSETSGAIATSLKSDFDKLNTDTIQAEMRKLRST